MGIGLPAFGLDLANSLAVIARDFEGVPDDERRLMTSDNVAALYGFS